MKSGVETINISVLKQYKSEFTSEQSSFKHSSYATFTNGYINHCDDPYIKIMAQKLNTMYASIEKGYSNIKSWWDKYISTYENLNLKLSNDSSELLTPLTDSVDNKELIESLDGDIGGLDSLDTYSPKTSENESNSVKEVLGNFKKKFPSEKKIFNKNEGLFEHIVDKANNDLIDELYGGAVGTLKVFGSGVLRGLEKFTDAGIAIDSGLMYIGGKAVGIFDKEKGKEYTDYAKQYAADNISGMNDVVSGTEIVQNADQFRKESAETITGATNEKVGNFFDKYIYGSVEGIGEALPLLLAGGVAGKCLTGGASLLMKAGAFASLGFADGAGSSFKDNVIFNITDPQTGEIIRDENGEIIAIHALDNTLKSSMLGGLWGGISWGAGTFIGGANFFGNPLANSAARISIDSLFGAAETPVQSGIQTTYNGQSFKETFEANGGWSSIGSGVAMGAFMSACGEAKYLENASKYANLLESNPSEFARKLTEFGLSEVDAESAIKNMDPNKLIAEMLYMDEIKPAQKMDENGEKIPITDEKYKTELDKFARNINGENVPITVLDSAKSGVKQFINSLKNGAEYTKYFLFDSEVANAGFANPKAIADAFKSIGDKITGKGKKDIARLLESELNISQIYDENPNLIAEIFREMGYSEEKIVDIFNNSSKETTVKRINQIINLMNGKSTESRLSFAEYNGDLKAFIRENMPSGLSESEKAYYIYRKLNKELSYSTSFLNEDYRYTSLKSDIYNKKINIEFFNNEDVVCSNWAQMYGELLASEGINCKIVGGQKVGNHKYIFLEADGKYYYADAFLTRDEFNSDVYNSQTNNKTNCFFQISKEQYDNNVRMSALLKDINEIKNNPNSPRAIEIQNMDRKLGYDIRGIENMFNINENFLSRYEYSEYFKVKSKLITDLFEQKIMPKIGNMGVLEGNTLFDSLDQNYKTQIWTGEYENKFDGSLCTYYSLPNGNNYVHFGKGKLYPLTGDIKTYFEQTYNRIN